MEQKKTEKAIDKQDEIISLLKQIAKNTAPEPKWKRTLKFIFSHLLTILVLILVAYLSWEIYSLLGSVSDKVTSIKDAMSEFFSVDTLKFWD